MRSIRSRNYRRTFHGSQDALRDQEEDHDQAQDDDASFHDRNGNQGRT